MAHKKMKIQVFFFLRLCFFQVSNFCKAKFPSTKVVSKQVGKRIRHHYEYFPILSHIYLIPSYPLLQKNCDLTKNFAESYLFADGFLQFAVCQRFLVYDIPQSKVIVYLKAKSLTSTTYLKTKLKRNWISTQYQQILCNIGKHKVCLQVCLHFLLMLSLQNSCSKQ